MEEIIWKAVDMPCGEMILASYGGALCRCGWMHDKHPGRTGRRLAEGLHAAMREGDSPVIAEAERQLREYFARQRREFSLPLLFVGSEFQKRAWQELQRIPYGQRVTYAEMARRMGAPKAVRAVANAMGANAIAIIVPCHRVVGSDGRLTGFAGGIEAKRLLLDVEAADSLF